LTASVSFPALGSTAIVAACTDDRLSDAVAAARGVVEAFDLACSRFREDSELSAVNRAAGRSIRVSPLMLEAADAGGRAASITDGDVDPTLGTALVSLGYDRDFALGLDGRGAAGARRFASLAGWRTIRIDARAGTVGVAQGVTLDLGATAKALACDHAAAAAGDAAGCGVLVGLGGDLAAAGEAPGQGWPVRVTDDHAAGTSAPGQWITISSGGLATSSTTVRRWRRADGESAHHVLDPATGESTRGGMRTASVAAASCLDANIASTAAIVRGSRAVGWLQELRLPGRLVSDDGVAIHVAGWPAEGDDLVMAGAGEGDDLVVAGAAEALA
jgi:thiamine biosynthesis lipoprotein